MGYKGFSGSRLGGVEVLTGKCFGCLVLLDTLCRQNKGLSEVLVSIPGVCEYVASQGQRDLVDVIKLRILTWGDYSGLPGQA